MSDWETLVHFMTVLHVLVVLSTYLAMVAFSFSYIHLHENYLLLFFFSFGCPLLS